MAERISFPDDPSEAPTEVLTLAQGLDWQRILLQIILGIILPIGNIDAKFAKLIGDDAKRSLLESSMPSWLKWIRDHLTSVEDEYLPEGVFAKLEHCYHNEADFWMTQYDVVRDLGYGIYGTLHPGGRVERPFYYRTVLVGYTPAFMLNHWAPVARPEDVFLPGPTRDITHMIGAVAGALTIADALPYPHLNVEWLDKPEVTFDTTLISWRGAIADIEASKEIEVQTRLAQWRQSVPASHL